MNQLSKLLRWPAARFLGSWTFFIFMLSSCLRPTRHPEAFPLHLDLLWSYADMASVEHSLDGESFSTDSKNL